MSRQFKPKTGGRGIEWTDRTAGPTGGCMHDCKWKMSDGTIAGCYAKQLAEHGVAAPAYPHGFEHHYFRPKALRELIAGDSPELIFCDSMSDLFAAPREHAEQVFQAMPKAPHHSYQSLTKAAPMILKYLDLLPRNLWVGVSSPPDFMMGKELSLKQQQAMLRRAMEVLAEVKAKTGNVVWMSAEPLSWDLTCILDKNHPLDWIVIGAASDGPKYFQPDPQHVEKLLKLMDETATPVFFKGNIGGLFKKNKLATDALNRWREDFPTHYRDGSVIPAVARRQEECQKRGWTRTLPLPVRGNSP